MGKRTGPSRFIHLVLDVARDARWKRAQQLEAKAQADARRRAANWQKPALRRQLQGDRR